MPGEDDGTIERQRRGIEILRAVLTRRGQQFTPRLRRQRRPRNALVGLGALRRAIARDEPRRIRELWIGEKRAISSRRPPAAAEGRLVDRRY